jgi:hypothetical protein
MTTGKTLAGGKTYKNEASVRAAVYYESHKEERAAYNADYYKANKEAIVAASSTYYKTHKKEMVAAKAAYYEAHKEKAASYAAAYRKANKVALDSYDRDRKEEQRVARLRRKYNLSIADFDSMLASQNGLCAICGTDKPPGRHGRWNVDHCHTTGKVRGLLCNRCNAGLGQFNDSPQRLLAAIQYLGRS